MALQLQVQPYHHHEEAFLADIGFGYDGEAPPSWAAPWQDNPVVTSPEEGTSSGSGGTVVASASGSGDDDGSGGGGDRYRCPGDDDGSGGGERGRGAGNGDDERRRLSRKISNRESARRSRARKQRHLDEQHAAAALLRASNRDLAERLRGARARSTLAELANARLRDEGAALGRRLAAASRALAIMQLYAAYASTPADPACRR